MCIHPGEKLAKFQIQNGFNYLIADDLDPFNTIWNCGQLHLIAPYNFKLNLTGRCFNPVELEICVVETTNQALKSRRVVMS